MLNLSKREQAKRFLKRIDHPEKNWKFSPATSGSGATGTTTSRPSKPC
jgi:polyphosphate kinase 2 (PPK2 family)